jgi:ABC-type multidrug transport system ATPase subunit
MSIKVQNVTKLFGAQKALNNVSFEIQSGEIVGFLGPNGAGKSTLMKIITGFIPPSEGDVFVNSKMFSKIRWKSEKLWVIYRSKILCTPICTL